MKTTLDFTIEEQDFRILFLKMPQYKLTPQGFEAFKKECKESYVSYFNRNTNNLTKYGEPKTFSQWINAQIIVL
jgi:hypothetical protein